MTDTNALDKWCSKPIKGPKAVEVPTNAVEGLDSAISASPPLTAGMPEVSCEDTPGGTFAYFFEKKECTWLATLSPVDISQYCEELPEARYVCQKTCMSCGEEKPDSLECKDSDSATAFRFRGKDRTCEWLQSRKEKQKDKLCAEGEPARDACPLLCGACSP